MAAEQPPTTEPTEEADAEPPEESSSAASKSSRKPGKSRTSWKTSPWWLILAAGFAWWPLGHLSWLLRIDTLGTDGVRGGDGAGSWVLLIPMVPGSLWVLVPGCLLGGVLAGMCTLVARRSPWRGTAASFLGLALCTGIVLQQTSHRIRNAPGLDGEAAETMLTEMTFTVILSTLVGWLFGVLSVRGRASVGMALAVIAGVLPSWLPAGWTSWDLLLQSAPLTLAQWSAGGVLTISLIVLGGRPLSRMAWWPVSVLLFWFTAAAITVVASLDPSFIRDFRMPHPSPDSLGEALSLLLEIVRTDQHGLLVPGIAGVLVGGVIAVAVRPSRPGPNEQSTT